MLTTSNSVVASYVGVCTASLPIRSRLASATTVRSGHRATAHQLGAQRNCGGTREPSWPISRGLILSNPGLVVIAVCVGLRVGSVKHGNDDRPYQDRCGDDHQRVAQPMILTSNSRQSLQVVLIHVRYYVELRWLPYCLSMVALLSAARICSQVRSVSGLRRRATAVLTLSLPISHLACLELGTRSSVSRYHPTPANDTRAIWCAYGRGCLSIHRIAPVPRKPPGATLGP